MYLAFGGEKRALFQQTLFACECLHVDTMLSLESTESLDVALS